MKKVLKIVGVLVGVLVLVLVLVTVFLLGPAVRGVVTTGGPAVLGVPVEMGRTLIFPLRGKVHVNDVTIGNPEGFKSESLFRLGRFKVDMQPRSVFSDTIVINEIVISGVAITYETTGLRSNLGRLLDNLSSADAPTGEGEAPAEESAPAESGGAGKKVIIERLVVEDVKLSVAATLAGGKGITLPLSRIELNELGKRSGGITGAEAAAQVIKAITVGVTKALAENTAALAGAGIDAAQALGGAALKGASGAVDLAAEGASQVAEAGSKTVDAVAEGVGDSVQAVADTVGSGIKSVGKSAGKLAGGLGSLLGGEDEDPKPEDK
jgi:uncharacterized protein involved in outer membrane biogenesis